MITLRLFSASLLTTLILTGCAGVGGREYISYSPATCQDIVYTCPQSQASFTSWWGGCGCEPTDAPDDPESRTLASLVQTYVAQRMDVGDQQTDAIFSDFILLDAEETGTPHRVDYIVWGVASAYGVQDGEVVLTDSFDGLMKLDLEETGKGYIIHGHTLPAVTDPAAEGYDAAVRALVTEEAAMMVLDNEAFTTQRQGTAREVAEKGKLFAEQFFQQQTAAAQDATQPVDEQAGEQPAIEPQPAE